jgi:hypothetical protein
LFDLAHLGFLPPRHIGTGETLALAEGRYQAEHQQLAEVEGRSFLQRLKKLVLMANP